MSIRRNYCAVIAQMIEVIPKDRVEFIAALEWHIM